MSNQFASTQYNESSSNKLRRSLRQAIKNEPSGGDAIMKLPSRQNMDDKTLKQRNKREYKSARKELRNHMVKITSPLPYVGIQDNEHDVDEEPPAKRMRYNLRPRVSCTSIHAEENRYNLRPRPCKVSYIEEEEEEEEEEEDECVILTLPSMYFDPLARNTLVDEFMFEKKCFINYLKSRFDAIATVYDEDKRINIIDEVFQFIHNTLDWIVENVVKMKGEGFVRTTYFKTNQLMAEIKKLTETCNNKIYYKTYELIENVREKIKAHFAFIE
jgi:hypothetical protein